MAFVSETHLTVRYAETDMMGIVHHSRYYPWFEVARTDFIKKIGMSYTEMEKMGIMLPLTETAAKYYYGLKYEDEVYSIEKQRFPKIGSKVKFENREVKVLGLNVINDLVKIDNNGAIIFVNLDEIKFKNGVSKNG